MTQPILAQEPDFAAFVAIDWSDREHAWALEEAGAKPRERGKLEHTPEAIEIWAAELAARFAGRPIAVALEQARGALIYALSRYGHLVLYPIHPSTSSRYREALFPSGRKDDPQDADLLLDLLVQQRKRLRPLQPDTEQTRKLQTLVEQRRRLVDERTAQTNRITNLLKLYFPQALTWFGQPSSPLAAAALECWPTLERLQAQDPEQLRQFFRRHRCSPQRIQQRLEEIPKARPALQDPAIVEPAVLMVQILLRMVTVLRQGIAQIEHNLQEAFTTHPDASLFTSFPGAGPAMAPRLLAAFGSQRDRFSSAAQIQSYSGIAPVIARSGQTQCWIHFRWACPKFLRQSFHEFAACSIPRCAWAKAYYQHQKDKQKGHHAAVRALAYKWLRILFRCWQNHQPYQEDLYLAVRERRARPLPSPQPAASHPGLSAPAACAKPQNSELKRVGDLLKFLLAEA